MTLRASLLAFFALLGSTAFSAAAELRIFAAASLSEALTELAPAYERSSADKLRFNFAASSLLARQIKEGAPADVFFSADDAKMDDLAVSGLIETGTRRTLLSNTLAIVVSARDGASVTSPHDLVSPRIRRIALAEPNTVPAGIYAKTFLVHAGLWEKLSTKILPTENVRACLAAVESGNVDAAIVYKTDALISKKVAIAFEVPSGEGPKIAYPLAVVKGATDAEAARRFVVYLASPEARAVFQKYGFLPAP